MPDDDKFIYVYHDTDALELIAKINGALEEIGYNIEDATPDDVEDYLMFKLVELEDES